MISHFIYILPMISAFGDTGLAVYRRYYEEEVTKIGISAHLGGMAAGTLSQDLAN